MSNEDEVKPAIDYLAIIDGYEPMREMLRGIVAMFVADGFTDEQARALAVYTATGYRFNDDSGSTETERP